MGELKDLPNIGDVLVKQLTEVGITTAEKLREEGSRKAWLKIRAIDESACINRLYALEGAVQGVRKAQLDEQTKAELKEFYNNFHLS